jgi:hypothetical protein
MNPVDSRILSMRDLDSIFGQVDTGQLTGHGTEFGQITQPIPVPASDVQNMQLVQIDIQFVMFLSQSANGMAASRSSYLLRMRLISMFSALVSDEESSGILSPVQSEPPIWLQGFHTAQHSNEQAGKFAHGKRAAEFQFGAGKAAAVGTVEIVRLVINACYMVPQPTCGDRLASLHDTYQCLLFEHKLG